MNIPRVNRAFIVGIAIAASPFFIGVIWRQTDRSAPIYFSRYERFLGFGKADVDGAQQAFFRTFPVGTPLGEVERYFEKIHGDCVYSKPDRALLCSYGWSILWPLPIGAGWSATIRVDEQTNTLRDVQLSAGIDAL
jgi:hypothetical protein